MLTAIHASYVNVDEGEPVTLTCSKGHRFPDGYTKKVATCDNGIWNITSKECLGKLQLSCMLLNVHFVTKCVGE